MLFLYIFLMSETMLFTAEIQRVRDFLISYFLVQKRRIAYRKARNLRGN